MQGEVTTGGNGEPPRRRETNTEKGFDLCVQDYFLDAFAGRISYFKVFSGILKNESTSENFSSGSSEKLSAYGIMKENNVPGDGVVHAGDISTVVAKLKDTLTGDTLGDKTRRFSIRKSSLPEPAITFALEPRPGLGQAEEVGVHKLLGEDAMLRFFRDPQTKEFLIAGTGRSYRSGGRADKKRYQAPK